MSVFCGIDWAEQHHDVALVDPNGTLIAKARITDDAAGYQQLLGLLAEHGDTESEPIPVAIETSRGLLVAILRTGKRQVFAINPLAASRYRDRHGVSRKKSDPGDALVLANILRTDMHAHRPLPADSELAQSIAVLARAQQDAVWHRQQAANQLRSLLREFYPTALNAFITGRKGGLAHPEARAILAIAPTPTAAAKLTKPQIRAALKRGGRQRYTEAETKRLQEAFRAEHAHQPPLVEEAMGKQMLVLLQQLDAAAQGADSLAEAVESSFREHPDAQLITSFPGLGCLLGARILAEIGDDRDRFADARALKAYAGSAPVTRASGKKRYVGRRFVKNNRLTHAGYLWSFAAITVSPGANAHYRRRRDRGDWHAAAQRNLFNRMLGMLHHCLQHQIPYDEHRAFAPLLEATPA
ncbi:IS110 family transposase [Streptomyces sp. DSM 3412]|uniref:IS110 family transposase n=1 Tax=Streptomyces gottesmaniae TaxID=3075518 RepID=A0ABU2YYT1_9ACTN|nr:IS110 family transposase [Streptomyces sp. DSM 3412]MDT0568559.1 IS110 family transposase [Streptomyces sp. DSM 3412]